MTQTGPHKSKFPWIYYAENLIFPLAPFLSVVILTIFTKNPVYHLWGAWGFLYAFLAAIIKMFLVDRFRNDLSLSDRDLRWERRKGVGIFAFIQVIWAYLLFPVVDAHYYGGILLFIYLFLPTLYTPGRYSPSPIALVLLFQSGLLAMVLRYLPISDLSVCYPETHCLAFESYAPIVLLSFLPVLALRPEKSVLVLIPTFMVGGVLLYQGAVPFRLSGVIASLFVLLLPGRRERSAMEYLFFGILAVLLLISGNFVGRWFYDLNIPEKQMFFDRLISFSVIGLTDVIVEAFVHIRWTFFHRRRPT